MDRQICSSYAKIRLMRMEKRDLERLYPKFYPCYAKIRLMRGLLYSQCIHAEGEQKNYWQFQTILSAKVELKTYFDVNFST